MKAWTCIAAIAFTLLSTLASAQTLQCPQVDTWTRDCTCSGGYGGTQSCRQPKYSGGAACGSLTCTACNCQGGSFPIPSRPITPPEPTPAKADVLEIQDSYDGEWEVPNAALGAIRIARSDRSRDLSIACESLSNGNYPGVNSEKWIRLRIYGRGGDARVGWDSGEMPIDNATKAKSPTLRQTLDTRGGVVVIEKSDQRAKSAYLKCQVKVE